MAETSSGSPLSTTQLVLVPGLITLGVTLLRLVGELQHWSEVLFRRSPGGGGAIMGIVWLAPLFGIYFALKLAGAGQGPRSAAKAIVFAIVGLAILFVGVYLGYGSLLEPPTREIAGYVVMAAGAALQLAAWPALGKVLLAYGYAARIPVAIVMFFAIRGNWGTHYDAPPPGYPANVPFWTKYFQIGLLPQLIFWVVFTVVVGALFGSVATAIARRGKPAPQAAR